MKNAIGILTHTPDQIAAMIQWMRSTIRYTLMFCGMTIGAVDEQTVQDVFTSIITEVEEERHSIKEHEGTLNEITNEDLQQLVIKLVSTLVARSANITNAIQVNQTLEQFANLITECAMQAPNGKCEGVQLSLASIKAVCPPLGSMIGIKIEIRKDALRTAQIESDRKAGLIGKAGGT